MIDPLDLLSPDQQQIVRLRLQQEIELLKQEHHHKLQMELLKQEHHHKLQMELLKKEHEMEMLKKDYSIANWETIKSLKCISIRSFINMFDSKCLGKQRDRRDRFNAFAQNNSSHLALWGFTQTSFTDSVMQFYTRMCQSAHPEFDVGATLTIPEQFLQTQEWRVLGVMWEQYPLPLVQLKMCKSEEMVVSVCELKNIGV